MFSYKGNTLFIFVSIIFLIYCCSNSRGTVNESIAVYTAVIDTVDQEIRNSISKYKKVAIIDTTQTFSFDRYPVTPDSAYFEEQFPDLAPSTFRSYLKNNDKKRSLPKELLKNRIPCNRDDPESHCLLFSDIGFNKTCDQAMVSFVYICGGDAQCGYKEFVLLEKEKGRWVIKNDFITYEV